jgi:adhesin transport system outer membrane protein
MKNNCIFSVLLKNIIIFFLLFIPLYSSASTLNTLIASALKEHPSVLAQRARIQESTFGVDNARWQFYPTPSLSSEVLSSDKNYYPGDNKITVLSLRQPIWSGGKLTADLEQAETVLKTSQASLDEIRLQISTLIIQVYGDWLASTIKIKALSMSQEKHTRLLDQINRRIDKGASSVSDRKLAVSRLEVVKADLVSVQAKKQSALIRLSQLLGYPVNDEKLMAGPIAMPFTVKSNTPERIDLLIENHPTIQKMQKQAEEKKAIIARRKADLFPNITLRAERQYGNRNYVNTTPENRVFIDVSTSFGAGLSNLSNIDEGVAQYNASLYDLEYQRRTLKEQILSDYAQATVLQGRVEALSTSLEDARLVSASYSRQFLAGRKSWMDVMGATRDEAQISVQLADSKANQIVLTWRLLVNTNGISAITGDKNEF